MSRAGYINSRVSVLQHGRTVYDKGWSRVLRYPKGESVGFVRSVVSLKMTRNYNSGSIECGIEMPWPIPPGDLDAAKRGLRKAEKLLDAEMGRRSQDLKRLLRSIGEAGEGK